MDSYSLSHSFEIVSEDSLQMSLGGRGMSTGGNQKAGAIE
jgi:hypothetical protein